MAHRRDPTAGRRHEHPAAADQRPAALAPRCCPALALLSHQVKILPAEGSALLDAPDSDLVLVDGRQELAHARDLCRLIRTTGTDVPVLLIVTEGGLAVVADDWGMDDVVLHTCGPAELEARIRLAIGRLAAQREADDPEAHVIRSGEVVVDDATYTAKLGGRPLDLTFKEFELLKYLAQHPGRVFTPRAAAAGGLGLRLLRRHPHRRRPRTPAARQARPRARDPDRHRPQRRLPLRAARQGQDQGPRAPGGLTRQCQLVNREVPSPHG